MRSGCGNWGAVSRCRDDANGDDRVCLSSRGVRVTRAFGNREIVSGVGADEASQTSGAEAGHRSGHRELTEDRHDRLGRG